MVTYFRTPITKNENEHIVKYTDLVESRFGVVFDQFVRFEGNFKRFVECTAQVKDCENLPFLFEGINHQSIKLKLNIHKGWARVNYSWTGLDRRVNELNVTNIEQIDGVLTFVR